MAEANVEYMATQLEQWGTKLDALVARVVAPGVASRIDDHEGIDDLKTKYEVARGRFDEFETAGSAKWGIFKSGIERAWNDFEIAFKKLATWSIRRNHAEGDNS